MKRTVADAIAELCLSLPDTARKLSHGIPTYTVAGKAFAHFLLNHHGDGRVALWLRTPKASQSLYTDLATGAYFVPPYVGPRGWLGVELNKGLDWKEIVARVREAFENVAPASVAKQLPATIDIAPPNVEMTPEEINPFLGNYPSQVLAQLEELCRVLPETARGENFGSPAWKAGKKTFVRAHHQSGRLQLLFWTGVAIQSLLTEDPRYSIPKYYGNSGWIELDVQDQINWAEVENLLETSYRHFALKRMLKALDGG